MVMAAEAAVCAELLPAKSCAAVAGKAMAMVPSPVQVLRVIVREANPVPVTAAEHAAFPVDDCITVALVSEMESAPVKLAAKVAVPLAFSSDAEGAPKLTMGGVRSFQKVRFTVVALPA